MLFEADRRTLIVRDGLLLLVLCVVLYLPGLGHIPLWDDDETRFACVAREMLQSGDWTVPRYAGQIADKPAAFFWLVASSFALFGETPFAARIVSALCGIVAVLVSWRTMLLLSDARTALWSAVALASSLLFVVEARAATMDMALLLVLSLLMHVVVAGWWKSGSFSLRRLDPGKVICAGALAGAGVLLKGLVAVMLPLLVLGTFAFLVQRGERPSFVRLRDAVDSTRPLLFLCSALFVAAPWHASVVWKTGSEWLEIFYLQHHLGRISGVMEGHGGFPFLQVPMLLAGFFPWSVFLPLSLWRCCREGLAGRREPASALAVVWLLVWLLVFSLSATQLPNYLLPAYPAAAFMVGKFLVGAIRRPDKTGNFWFHAAASGLILGGLVIAAAAYAVAFLQQLPRIAQMGALLALIQTSSALLLSGAVHLKKRKLGLVFFAAGAMALFSAVFFWVAPVASALDPLPRFLAVAGQGRSAPATWATYRFSVPGLFWRSGSIVEVCRSPTQLLEFLSGADQAMALVNADAVPEIAAILGSDPKPLAIGRPLLRTHDVWLLGSCSLQAREPRTPEDSILEVPRGEDSRANDPAGSAQREKKN